VKPVRLCRASIRRKMYSKLLKIEEYGALALRVGTCDVTMHFTANRGPAQRNGFHYPIVVSYAESDYVYNSYQWRSPLQS